MQFFRKYCQTSEGPQLTLKMIISHEFTIFDYFILHSFLLKWVLKYVTAEQTSQPKGSAHHHPSFYHVAIFDLYMSNMYGHIHLILICFFWHSF